MTVDGHALELPWKERSLPPGDAAVSDESSTFTTFEINDRRERGNVRPRFWRKRSTCSQVLFVTLWARIVGGEEAKRSEAVVHFAEVCSARQDVVARIKRVNAQSISNAQFDQVRGMICISPRAPLGEVTCSSHPLSRCMTTRIRCAGIANRRDASVIKGAKDSTENARDERDPDAIDSPPAITSDSNTVVRNTPERQAASPRSRKPAIVLTVVRRKVHLRQPRNRPGPPLRVAVIAILAGTE